MPAITINGKVYTNPEDIPPDLQEAYQKALEVLHDSDGNGVPDFLEGKPLVNISGTSGDLDVEVDTRFIVGDNVFTRLDELPPEARMKYERAMQQVAKILPDMDGDGIPDLLDGTSAGAGLPHKTAGRDISAADSMPSVFHEETPDYGRIIKLVVMVIILLALIGLAGYFFLTWYH